MKRHKDINKILPYTYLIYSTTENQLYYGVRWAKEKIKMNNGSAVAREVKNLRAFQRYIDESPKCKMCQKNLTQKQFIKGKITCSNVCAAKYRHAKQGNILHPIRKQYYHCRICNNTLSKDQVRRGTSACSMVCAGVKWSIKYGNHAQKEPV